MLVPPIMVLGLFHRFLVLSGLLKVKLFLDNRVCVYAGSGAVLAGDVEYTLERLEISYREDDLN